MKCSRIIFALVVFIVQSYHSSAQAVETNRFLNCVEFSSDFLRVPRTIYMMHSLPDDEIGVRYQRKVYANFGIELNYSFWNKLNSHKTLSGTNDYYLGVQQNSTIAPSIGTIYGRQAYHFAEIGPIYYLNLTSHFSLQFALGYTYSWGTNKNYSFIWINPDPPYDAMFNFSTTNITYQGIYAGMKLDYFLLHNRVNVGLEIKDRQMSGSFSEFVAGIHAGINF